MNRYRTYGIAIASIFLGLLAAAPARAASLVMVPRATWGATGVPTYMQMYIYVPDRVATKPPIYISCHSCGSTATGQIGNIPLAKAQADSQGFILLLPDNPGNNCWAVGTTQGLTHDGGGDTHALAQMIQYVLKQYNADPGRVYIMGGSGGAMFVQAMLATYPNLIRAGSARAGVAAGCWADGYSASNQWSNNCAAGNTNKTAQQWGDQVRGMYPGYTGHRPRVQLYHGDADTTINYRNMNEAIEEWTNVLGLSMTPTSTDTGYMAASARFNRQFWKNSCGQTVIEAWTAPGATHSMTYEEGEMLKFFGLNAANTPDPEMDCGGTGGTGGATGTGGAGGAGWTWRHRRRNGRHRWRLWARRHHGRGRRGRYWRARRQHRHSRNEWRRRHDGRGRDQRRCRHDGRGRDGRDRRYRWDQCQRQRRLDRTGRWRRRQRRHLRAAAAPARHGWRAGRRRLRLDRRKRRDRDRRLGPPGRGRSCWLRLWGWQRSALRLAGGVADVRRVRIHPPPPKIAGTIAAIAH